ncbi:hypothetical protein LXL04_029019 [Taraxacum kok-saghyz]
MVGVNSSYSVAQNDVVFVLRVSKCRRFTVYPHSVVFSSRRLHPSVHVYQSNGSYFMFSLLLMSSSRYIFYSIVSLPIFSLPLFPFQTSAMLPFCCAGFFLKMSLAESLWFSLYRFASCTGFFLKIFCLFFKASQRLVLFVRVCDSMPFSTHILLISLWRKLIRKICVEKSMKLSGVSFPGISMEDSLSIGFFLKM